MSLDLEQFHQAFFEECAESLDSMEMTLLNLDPAVANPDAINAIFRGAHSIKGGSATFGFSEVAAFTHVMETLLDRMRDGRLQPAREHVDLLLESVDCLRGMLLAVHTKADMDRARVADVQQRLEASLEQRSATAPAGTPASEEFNEDEFDALLDQLHGAGKAPGAIPARSDEITDAEFDQLLDTLHGKGVAPTGNAPVWKINFRPHRTLMQRGNDPLRIFAELESLGRLSVRCDVAALPAWPGMIPEESHLAWTLELEGEATRAQIDEAFAWVDGECDLTMTPPPAATPKRAPAAVAPPATAPVSNVPKPTPASAAPTPVAPAKPAMTAKAAAPANTAEATSIRVGIDKIDALINMVGELVITQSMLSQLGENFDMDRLPKLVNGLAQLERNTRELQESVMRIRMLPISFAFNRFPRLVHDLSQKLGKQVELKMTGEQTELDKTVMEKIGDPLVHLVRNSLDHGIEMPDVRHAAGKPETGTLHLNAYHQSGNIVIEISDDGAGLKKDRIVQKAKERGLIADEKGMSDDKIYELIFLPGFSTADAVSDLSGRGVGMDVVRRNIKGLGGNVEITSREGQGTTITIRLPLTLAILDGQTVRVGDDTYIIPLVSIVESIHIQSDMVNVVAGKSEVIRLREEYLPVMRLYEIFNVAPRTTNLLEGLLVVVEGEGMKAGLFVDELLGQQQIVIKSLESNFKRIDGVSGATILGDGMVALILDIPGLIKLARKNNAGGSDRRLLSGIRAA